jgi:hypothetical protein
MVAISNRLLRGTAAFIVSAGGFIPMVVIGWITHDTGDGPPGLGILGVATSAIAALGSLGLLPIVIGGLYGKFSPHGPVR